MTAVVPFTSFEPAGPTTASTLAFPRIACALFSASAVPFAPPSCVSPLNSLNFVLWVLLYVET